MKKRLQQLLSILMTTMLLVGNLPVSAFAETQIVSNAVGGNYNITDVAADAPQTNTVQVQFVDFDGTVLQTATVDVGGSYDTASWPTPSRAGYDFEGWTQGGALITALTDLQADVTLTALYVQLFTLTFENWDGTQLATVDNIPAGTNLVTANYYSGTPTRDGFGFDHWEPQQIDNLSANTTVVAAFAQLAQHTVVINYIYKNMKQAAVPYVAMVSDGYNFNETVTSPSVVGYTPDQASVSISEPITHDYSVDVTYLPNASTRFVIAHMQQTLTGEYVQVDTTERSGETGSMTALTQDDVNTYEGFSLLTNLNTCNAEIAADGSTVIQLQYDRNIHYVLFSTLDGTYIEPQVGLYGTPVVTPADPIRVGYTFSGWDIAVPATIGSTDVTLNAVWTPQNVAYTVVVWRENANDTNYSYATTITGQTALSGSTVNTFNTALVTDAEAGYFTYHHCDAITVKGDGSSILNVYYSRNTYYANFLLARNGAYLTANGTTYTHSGDNSHVDYSFTAKYDSNISNLWPSYVGPDGAKFQGWTSPGASNLFTSKRLTFTPELLSRNYTANYDGTCKDTLIYQLETPNGTGTAHVDNGVTRYFSPAANLAQTVFTVGGGWAAKEISGFTNLSIESVITGGSNYNPTARTVTLYYARNKNIITFHNGDTVTTTPSIYFEASITSYNYTPTRPSAVPSDYVYTGWYTDAHLYDNSLFVWTGAIMPANGLIVYAGWEKPSYPVDFEMNYTGGGLYVSQLTEKGETTDVVANPVRAGYHFDYWYYYDNGVEKMFTFSMPITHAYVIYAHWTASTVNYTVRYLDNANNPVYDADNHVIPSKTGEAKVADLITEYAVAAYNSAGEAVYCDQLSTTITLDANAASNVITFYYTREATVYYVVRYVDSNGNEIAQSQGPTPTTAAAVTLRYLNIAGYSPTVYQQTRVLAKETSPGAVSLNVITFVYNSNAKGTYTVQYYLQNVNDNGYTRDDSATVTVTDSAIGTTVNATVIPYAGFTYVSGISVASGVVYTTQTTPLTLSIYYNRNLIGYSASYLDEATSPYERLVADTSATARYGKTITLLAKDIPGYTLDQGMSPSPTSLLIGLDAAANHVDFYYMLRTDIVVTVRYLDQQGNNIATSREFTGATDRNVKLGASYSYTLLESEKIIEFNGETYRHVATEATTATCTVAESGNLLDFHYVPDTYAVYYNANGGTGAPTDSNRYRAYADVAIAAGVPTYGINTFVGWTTDVAAVGQVYETLAGLSAIALVNDPFTMPKSDITLYAVWSHLTALLSYASDTPYVGTLPSGATVSVNTATTVAGGSELSREGYTFAGWKLKNENGQLVDPAYGPGTANPTITINTDTTLYATWQPIGYTITYQNNLPAAAQSRWLNPNTLANYTVESADFTLLASSCTGYTFTGWYTDAAYQTLASSPALPHGSVGNQTFYAGFTLAPLDGLDVQGYTGAYDGNPHGVTFTDPNHELLPTDTVEYSTPNSYTDVTNGPVPVTVTVTRDGVVIWTGTANVTIIPKTIALTADSIAVLFDGNAHALEVTVPVGETGAASTADAEAIRNSLTFTVGGVTVPNSFTDAMVTTIVTVSSTNPNYTITPATPTVTISRRVVTITADSLTGVVYDGLPHTVSTWVVTPATETSGLIAGDTVSNVVLSDNTRTVVGESAPQPSQATLGVGTAANYDFVYINGVLEVVKSDALTITLSAGAGTYGYDGVTHGYTVDTAGVPVTLEYRIGSGDWQTVSASNPLPSYVDVGDYPLTVRASNPNYENVPTDTKTLSITARDVTVRAGTGSFAYTGTTFTVDSWSVDAATANSGLIGTDTITEVTLSNNTRSALGSNPVGIAVASWSMGANPANYNVITVEGSIEVTQNTGVLGVTLSDLGVIYDGDGHHLSYTVDVPDNTPYTVYYKLGDGDWVALDKDELLPSEVDAGVYNLAIKIESPNYSGVGEDAATLTIQRRAITLTAGTSLGNVYDGDPVSVAYTASQETEFNGLLDGDTVNATLVGTPQTETGNYQVSFDQAQTVLKSGNKNVTANYNITYTNGQIEIVQAASLAMPTAISYVYDGTAHTYVAPVLTDAQGDALSNVTVAWSTTSLAADATGWNTTAFPTETEVKSAAVDAYQIYVRLTQPNYTTKIVTARLTITPAPVTLTADTNDNFPYTLLGDGTAKVWSITTAHWQIAGLTPDTLYAGDTITYELANNTQSEVNDGHAVTFASSAITDANHAKNYAITTVNGHIRVVRGTAESALTGDGLTVTYDANPHTLPQPTVTVEDEDGNPQDRTNEFTFTYEVTKDGDKTTYTTLPTFTDAGEYTVKIIAKSDVYTDPDPITVTVTINQRPLTLTSQTNSYAYDASEHSVTILQTVVGYAPATDHAVVAADIALLSGQTNVATLAGTYPVEIDPDTVAVFSGTTDVTANYAIAIVPGSLTITPTTVVAADLGLTDVTAVYDAQSHSLTMPASIVVGGNTIDLTDTTRFSFSFTELDLTVPSATENNVAANPGYTDVSQHRVTVQITDNTGSLQFEAANANVTVTKRDVTITPNSGTFLYDGTLHTVTGFTAPKAVQGGTTGLVGDDDVSVTLVDNTRTQSGSNLITWSDPTMLVGDIHNYNLIPATGTLTVNTVDTLTLSVTPDNSVYDAQTHGYTFVTNEPDAANLTLAYSTDGGSTWTPFTIVAELPTYTDAGNYPITIRASSPNFAAPVQTDATLVISPRPVSITPSDASFAYDGTPKQLSAYTAERADVDSAGQPTGNRGLLGTDDVTATLTNNIQTNAGSYPVGSENAQAVGNMRLANYAFAYGTGTLLITKRSGLWITLTADSAVYDSQTHGFNYTTNAVGDSTLEYTLDGGTTWTAFTDVTDLPTRVDASTTPLTVRVTNANYDIPTAADNATLTISPALLTLNVQSASFVYDGAPHSLVLTADGLVGSDVLDTYALNPDVKTQPGIYEVQAVQGDTVITNPERTGNQLSNYTVTLNMGTLTIVDFALDGYSGVYDGAEHGVTVTVPDAFVNDYVVTYTVDGVTTTENPQYSDAGTHTVTVTLTPVDPASGLPTFSKDETVTITAKPITLNVDSINKTYDGTYSALSVTLPEGAAATPEDAATLLANVTFTANGASIPNAFINAGSTGVTVGSTCANYTVTPVDTTVLISRRQLTITAGSATKVFDEQPITVTYTYDAAEYTAGVVTNATGLLRQHTLTATLIDDTRTQVCLEAPVTFDTALTGITEGGASVLANYDVRYVDGKITITQGTALTLNLTGYTGVYDAQAHGVSVASVLDGTRTVDPANFTWTFGETAATATSASLTRTDVSSLLVYVKGTSVDGNYPDVTGVAQLTITARPVLITPDSATYTYDGTTRTVDGYTTEKATVGTGNQRGLIGSDDATVTLQNNSQVAPGNYPITWTDAVMTSGSLSNYSLEHGDGSLVILKATQGLSIAMESDTLPYDAQEHRLTYTVDAPEGTPYTVEYSTDNGLTYTVVGADGLLPANTDAGAYPVKVRVTSPYYVDGYASTDDATLTLTKRVLNITSETNTFVYDKAEHTVQGLWQITPSTATTGLVNDSASGITHRIQTYDYVTDKNNAQTFVGGHAVLVDSASISIQNLAGEDVTANYAITANAGRIDVTAQAASAEATSKTVEYNGQPQTFTLPTLLDAAGNPVTEPVTYAYSLDGTTWSTTPITYEDVLTGGYTIHILAQSPNYALVETTAQLTITPAPITVSANTNDGFIYTLDKNGDPVEWSIDDVTLTSGTLFKGETLDFVLTNNTQSDVGEHAVTLTSAAVMLGTTDVSNNYQITLADGHIAVTQGIADAYLSVDPVSGIYKAEDYTLGMPVISVQTAEGDYVDKTSSYRIVYEVSKDGGEPITFTNTLPHFTDAGVYQVSITATSTKLTSPVTGATTITIDKLPITLTSGNNAATPYTYNGAEQSVDPYLFATGALAGADEVDTYTFATDASNVHTDVVDRAVTLNGVTILSDSNRDVTANYDITLTPGRIVIQPLVVSGALTLTGVSHVYDAGTHAATLSDQLVTSVGTYSLSGTTLESGDKRFSITYTATPDGGAEGAASATSPSFTDVTRQTITAYVTDATGNLLIVPESATLEVTKRDVTITPDSDTVAYDGQGHTITTYSHPKAIMVAGVAVGASGLVGDDDVSVTLVNNGPHTLPDTYTVSWSDPVTFTTGKASNYNLLHATGTLTITQATGIDLTLTADNSIYDGMEHGYTAIPIVPDNCPVKLEYLAQDGSWVEVDATHPLPTYVNAGVYPLTVRLSSPNFADTVEKTTTLTITKRNITIASGNNSASPYVYTGAEQSVTATIVASGTPLATGDTIDPLGTTFATGLSNANTEACDRAVTLTDVVLRNAGGVSVNDNYEITYASGRIVINKASTTITAATRSETYAGTPYAFAAPVLRDALGNEITDVSYAYSLTPLTASDSGWTEITDFPTREDVRRNASGAAVGDVIYVRVSHPNYGTQVTTSTLTITPAAISVEAGTNDSFVYTLDAGGNPITWSVTDATLTSGTLYKGATLDYTLSNNTQATVGGHSVFVNTCAVMFGNTDLSANYSIATVPGHIQVNKGTNASVIQAAGDAAEYDSLTHGIPTPIISVLADDGSTVDKTDEFTIGYDVTLAGSTQTWHFDKLSDFDLVNVGVYTVAISATSDLHADPANVTVTLRISPRQLTITSEDNSATPYTYNGNSQAVQGDWSIGNLLAGDSVTNLTYAAGQENSNVGVTDRPVLLSAVTVMDGRTDVTANYTLQLNPGRIVIQPLQIPEASIPIADVTTVYDGQPHTITLPTTIRTSVGTITLADEFTLTYRDGQGNVTNTLPTYTDVGVYPITVVLTSKSGNFAAQEVPTVVTITPRPLSVSYGKVSALYNGQPYTVPVTITGMVSRDALALTEINRTGMAVTRLADGTPGALVTTATQVTLTDAVDTNINRAANYSLTLLPGTLEIKPIPITVAVKSQTFVYDAKGHSLTELTLTGNLLDGQTLTADVDSNRAVHVVDSLEVNPINIRITDTATGADASENYLITPAPGMLTIEPAFIILRASQLTVLYDGLPHEPDVLLEGLLQGSDTLVNYSLQDMPQTNIGRYGDVLFDRSLTVIVNASGENVTADYKILYRKGSLAITAPTTSYTVNYYYDGLLDATSTLTGISGATVSTYPPRLQTGYRLDHVENVPLRLSRTAQNNVINVYYITSTLTTLEDLLTPLSGGAASYERGTGID